MEVWESQLKLWAEAYLDQAVRTDSSPEFVGATLSGATASRLLATDGLKAAASVADLTAWIAGTANRVTVANDGDGTVTISTPQDIHTEATPQFAGATLLNDGSTALLSFYSYGSTPSNQLTTYTAQGTAAIPAAVGIDDVLLQLGCFGYNGSSFVGTRVKFNFTSSQAWEVGKNGTQFTLQVTPNDTAARTTAIFVANTGYVGAGAFSRTDPPLEQLHSKAKVRADTTFNVNGTDGVTNTDPGVITDIDVSGGIVTAMTKNTQATFTPEGGLAIKLTNKTGGASVKGSVVHCSETTDDAFDLQADEFDAMGVVYENGIADGSDCLVVVAGIADVLLKDGTAATRGYWAKASDTDGRAEVTTAPSGIGALDVGEHFREIGHCIESKGSGSDVLAKCILHFN